MLRKLISAQGPYGPMAGVVNARCDFIDDQSSLGEEELHRQDPHIVHGLNQAISVINGLYSHLWRDARRDIAAYQNTVTHHVFSHGIACGVAVLIPANDNGVFGLDRDLRFSNDGVGVNWNRTQRLAVNTPLTAAVIAPQRAFTTQLSTGQRGKCSV